MKYVRFGKTRVHIINRANIIGFAIPDMVHGVSILLDSGQEIFLNNVSPEEAEQTLNDFDAAAKKLTEIKWPRELREEIRKYLCEMFIWSKTKELPEDECASEVDEIEQMFLKSRVGNGL